MAVNPAVNDPEVLEMLYWHEGLSMWQIAQRLDVAESTVHRRLQNYGIDRRGVGYDSTRGSNFEKYARYHVRQGYPSWALNHYVDDKSVTTVHQLTAIADGADPYDVYSDEKIVHHKNGVKWDNRPDNLEVMTRKEHTEHHAENGDLDQLDQNWYTEEELLSWIDAFVKEFGVVPSKPDIRNWPGPSHRTYLLRFESWPKAVQKAGYEPRGIQHKTD